MNKYQRQSQKSNLWARRRNKTADLLLDGQLRYLDKRCKQGIKQHLRGTSRLEEDLRDLVHITNSDDLNRDPQHPLRNEKSGFTSWPDPVRGQRSKRTVSTPSTTRTAQCLPFSSQSHSCLSDDWSCRGKPDTPVVGENPQRFSKHHTVDINIDIENGSTSNQEIVELRPRVGKSDVETPISSKHDNHDIDKSALTNRFLTFPESSTRSMSEVDFDLKAEKICRFNRDGKVLRSSCRHFPCLIPSTYHALGFRRDDASTWSQAKPQSGILNSSNFILDKKDSKSLGKVQNTGRSEGSSPDVSEPSQSKQNYRSRSDHLAQPDETSNCSLEEPDETEDGYKPSIPKWLRGHQPKKFAFRPVSGPSFGPKPRDPVLERVRRGHSQTPALDKQPARMTVAGRMRGLRSLIDEMREKHQQAKPVDWAVNYGQRLPMRVLLNPVVPVGIV
ncbi:hypothetical protein ElyMa_003473700 [Elysia marginata]|uniref:DUF4685 domain-containing protein n=1 Tax=Elysia marginata TaxID=1093978 RepID=A0AAV4EAW8_9GAST|nr:hypothetical protein ElyMa_003473700 [Elysia marginata]